MDRRLDPGSGSVIAIYRRGGSAAPYRPGGIVRLQAI